MSTQNGITIAIVNSSSFGRSFPDHISRLESFARVIRVDIPNGSPASVFHDKLGDIDGIIASVTPYYSREVLMGLPKLRLLSRHGVGCDNVDLECCTELGIAVSKVGPEVERESVAQMTMALMHSAARQVVTGADLVRKGAWAERAKLPLGLDFCGAKVGLVGIGAIGSTVARMLKLGYQADVLAYDPYLSDDTIQTRHARKVSLEELITTSDVISLHCPLTKETLRMFNREALAKVKPGVILVNTTRGEILDEAALIEGLQSGVISGYATDVVEGEPIGAEHRLLAARNVVITPHLGGYSKISLRGMGATMVDDMELTFVKNQFPGVLANPSLNRAESRIERGRGGSH
jgi:lactate dehydrogenase-like 2-hydroxyacid dehydrogenase